MIYTQNFEVARPNETIDVIMTGAADGLVGTIGVRLVNQDGVQVKARTTTGVTEVLTANGEVGYAYRMLLDVPAEVMYYAFWDTGSLTPETTGAASIFVTDAERRRYIVPPLGVVVTALEHAVLGGTPGVQILDNDGNVLLARTTTGVSQPAALAGSGFWIAQLSAPADDGDYSVLWDADYAGPGTNLTNLNTALDPFTVESVIGPPPPPGTTTAGAPMPLALMYCGREIANAARVFEYARNGYRPSRPSLTLRGDLPGILYRLSGASEVFNSPVTDPAPWYDPLTPESGDFIGLLLDPGRSAILEQTVNRASNDRASGLTGTAFGATMLAGLAMPFTGTLVAISDCGMEFGKAWLRNMLLGSDPCEQCLLDIRTCAPPEDGSDDDMGRWQLYEAVCTQAPTFERLFPNCDTLVETSFEVTAGNPWLYRPLVSVVAETLLWPDPIDPACIDIADWLCGPGSDPIAATLSNPPFGTNAAVLTFDATSDGVGTILVEIRPADADPLDPSIPVLNRFRIPLIVEGARLIVDSALHEITYIAPDGEIIDGSPYIVPDAGMSFQWVEVTADQADSIVYVSVEHPCGASPTATLQIDTRIRAA